MLSSAWLPLLLLGISPSVADDAVSVLPTANASAATDGVRTGALVDGFLAVRSDHRLAFDERRRSRAPPTRPTRQRQDPTNSVPPGGVCSKSQDCAGYPQAYCRGTCMCRDGALNAGSSCVERGTVTKGNCPVNQVFVSEAGICMQVVSPGERCQYSQQCSGREPGAFCLNQVCRCVYGMKTTATKTCAFVNTQCTQRGTIWIPQLGQCKPVVGPGARVCSHDEQCKQANVNTVCRLQQCTCDPTAAGQPAANANFKVAVDGTCGVDCPPGQSYSGVLGQCIATVAAGGSCRYSSQCHATYAGTVCDRGICRCPNGQVWTGSQCSRDCPPGYISNPTNGQCRPACNANTQVEYNGECLDKVAIGKLCRIRAQCLGGSDCVVPSGATGATANAQSVCTCSPGHSDQFGRCQQIQSGPGEVCGNGEACVGGSFCQGSLCACPAGTVVSNRQCLTPSTVPPGSRCGSVTVKCGGGSFCGRRDICECRAGKVVRQKRCQAPLDAYPGESCARSEVCRGGSFCGRRKRCECRAGKIILDRACQTPPDAYPGDSCARGEICRGDSFCDGSKRCRCETGLIVRDFACISRPRIRPGHFCQAGDECIGGSSCVEGTCACPAGLLIRGAKCAQRPRVGPGQSCAGGEICEGASLCIRGRCLCPSDDLIIREGRCVERPRVLPGQACREGDLCTGGSSCRGGFCTCPLDMAERNGRCFEQMRRHPGLDCQPQDICLGDSFCQGGVCICARGKIVKNDHCIDPPFVLPGERCGSGEICTRQSTCVEGVCTCNGVLVNIRQRCVKAPTVPPGSSCAGGESCSGGSVCENFVCVCPGSQVARDNVCTSPVQVPPGSSCLEDEICTGGSNCVNGVCTCPPGRTSIVNGLCTPPPIGLMTARAAPCPLPGDPSKCRLPDCFCSASGTIIPGGLTPAETPQMVMITLDDAIVSRLMPTYRRLFDGRFTNPDGCPIRGTFFVSHEWNNYDQTQYLFSKGNEIGVNSITHETLSDEPVDRWSAEMRGMREMLAEYATLPPNAIKGVRAPQLAVGGNRQWEMMRREGFVYDNSISVNPGRNGPPFWPQTLDYALSWDCAIPPCPDRPFPGLWAIPINQFYGYYIPEISAHKRGAMIRAAMKVDETPESVLNLLRENFARAYETTRAPFVLTLDADFFLSLPNNGSLTALENFLEEILAKEDVYIVSGEEVIDWMRSPTPLGRLNELRAWGCKSQTRAAFAPCEFSNRCGYDTELAGGEHWFRTCAACPRAYPWLNNPAGSPLKAPPDEPRPHRGSLEPRRKKAKKARRGAKRSGRD